MEANWCYFMCDSFVLPLVSIATAAVTIYQEYRHRKEKIKKK